MATMKQASSVFDSTIRLVLQESIEALRKAEFAPEGKVSEKTSLFTMSAYQEGKEALEFRVSLRHAPKVEHSAWWINFDTFVGDNKKVRHAEFALRFREAGNVLVFENAPAHLFELENVTDSDEESDSP